MFNDQFEEEEQSMPCITLERLSESLSNNTVGTDSLNALREIPGVTNAEVTEETENSAVVSYTWVAESDRYELIDELLRKYGLRRAI